MTVLIWGMILPMMLKVDFSSIRQVFRTPAGIALTLTVNWLVKPFTMYALAWLFFVHVFPTNLGIGKENEYIAGAVLLGAAPCTAMVFVWSYLTRGDAAYTLVQVALNDLVIPLLFAPIVAGLLYLQGVNLPVGTLILSVILFVVFPFVTAALIRFCYIRRLGRASLESYLLPRLAPVSMSALLITLILLFVFQGAVLTDQPLLAGILAIPLILQTLLIYGLSYGAAYLLKLPHRIACPAALIGASNFFELAVAVAIALFGLDSGAALVTVVGVLTEVPVMLMLVWVSNRTRHWFQDDIG